MIGGIMAIIVLVGFVIVIMGVFGSILLVVSLSKNRGQQPSRIAQLEARIEVLERKIEDDRY
jgi:cell division protein FtsB